ncbi:BMP family ABC transporter substrate-binding protein [Azospirillum halopraeferens]|uniref:BMP family ABC transporter substrate-binding protein n=1 Tax=Azospirillum halopraeferens TaxID=34010 RepID=UPI0004010BC9|nr:BMP family ABC transporter substrate-binding protein [Azospirillum halopraeferens]
MEHHRTDGWRVARRRFLAGVAGGALALAAPLGRAAEPLSVGFLYSGPRVDFGYNQAHADGAAATAALPGVVVHEAEAAGDLPVAVEELIAGHGCRVIFVTAPGDQAEALLAQADAHRDVTILLCGSRNAMLRLPVNVGVYDAYIDEGQHIAGMVAGYATRRRRIGFVASQPGPRVLRSVNAFALGARRVEPSVTVQLAFVGPEGSPAAAGRSLIAGGADVLAGHLPSLRPLVEEAEAAGVLCCGLHTDLSAVAPTALLTGAEWAWERLYTDLVTRIRTGRPWPRLLRGGFGEQFVRSTRYGPAVGVEARAHADAARMQLANGNTAVFRGPVKDNTGRLVLAKGASLPSKDSALDSIVWLVDGVVEAGY